LGLGSGGEINRNVEYGRDKMEGRMKGIVLKDSVKFIVVPTSNKGL
jgi:hypothetical protein